MKKICAISGIDDKKFETSSIFGHGDHHQRVPVPRFRRDPNEWSKVISYAERFIENDGVIPIFSLIVDYDTLHNQVVSIQTGSVHFIEQLELLAGFHKRLDNVPVGKELDNRFPIRLP